MFKIGAGSENGACTACATSETARVLVDLVLIDVPHLNSVLLALSLRAYDSAIRKGGQRTQLQVGTSQCRRARRLLPWLCQIFSQLFDLLHSYAIFICNDLENLNLSTCCEHHENIRIACLLIALGHLFYLHNWSWTLHFDDNSSHKSFGLQIKQMYHTLIRPDQHPFLIEWKSLSRQLFCEWQCDLVDFFLLLIIEDNNQVVLGGAWHQILSFWVQTGDCFLVTPCLAWVVTELSDD